MQKHTVFSLHLTKSFFVHFHLSSLIIKLKENAGDRMPVCEGL